MKGFSTKKGMRLPGAITMGVVTSMVMAVILCAVFSWLMESGRIPESSMLYCSAAVLILSALAGAFTASASAEDKKLLASLGSGVGFLFCLLACTALFFSGKYSGVGQGLLCVLGAAAAAGIAVQRPQKKGYAKAAKRRYR